MFESEIAVILHEFPSLRGWYADKDVVIMPDIGSKYVNRATFRCERALSRGEYARLVLESLETDWIIESVRWKWAEQDLYVSSMTFVHHLTP